MKRKRCKQIVPWRYLGAGHRCCLDRGHDGPCTVQTETFRFTWNPKYVRERSPS